MIRLNDSHLDRNDDMPSISDKKETLLHPRILLVDDAPLAEKVHRLKLEKLGCTVDSALNGQQALNKYKNEKKYDVILLDCELPDIDGLEVAKQIRQYEQSNQLAKVPIIMVTAYPKDSELQQACRKVGINEIFIKPIIDDQHWQELVKRFARHST